MGSYADHKPRQKGVKLLSSKLIYSGPAFKVYSDLVREGMHTGQRDVIRHTGSVVVLAVDCETTVSRGKANKEPRILLIRQYRYAADARMWELPAGRIDDGERTMAAAKRELLEETGYSAKRWKRIFQFYPSPGFLDETMDIYLALDLECGVAQPEEDEQISVRFFPFSVALEMVKRGQIRDGKTISSLLWLFHDKVTKGLSPLGH